MKLATLLLMTALGASAGMGVVAIAAEPTQPDPAYCSRRDADPEKCVIQDGPPQKHILRKKPVPPKPVEPVKPVPDPAAGSAVRPPEPAPVRRQ